MNTTVSEGESRKALKLDGARIAAEIRQVVADDAEWLKRQLGVVPRLAAVRVGNDPASAVYVRNKVRTSQELGLASEHLALPQETTTEELLRVVDSLNGRADVDGILVQLPLPSQIDEQQIIEAIDPAKDVDGFHPLNVGRLMLGQETFVPCTPAGILELLVREGVKIEGARACIVGRSNLVGRPMAELLLRRDATVTICHSRTRDLAAATREADILVAAVGRVGLIRGEHVKRGAIVVDVGMNRVTDEKELRELFGDASEKRLRSVEEKGYTLVGDVHPAEVEKVAGMLTPVPGGVGPLTVAMLMRNTITAAKRRRGAERQS
jgi:methylenetetrahydrofolate dehydrogenase (NADP+)/methenyltetrahydrofolate cyclohydrolase